MDATELLKGRDYYVDPDGLYVFTAAYLTARGHCCRSGCRHCPYGFIREGRAQGANGDGPDDPPEPSPPSGVDGAA